MSVPVFYYMGGEDVSYTAVGSGLSVDTTPGRFNSIARCAVGITNVSGYWSQSPAFSASSFWHSIYLFPLVGGGISSGGFPVIRWWDSTGQTRLQIRGTNNSGFDGIPFVLEKVAIGGGTTQLGSSFTIPIVTGTLGRLDIQIIYGITGLISIYTNLSSIPSFSFSGDLTTNGNTLLAGHDLLSPVNWIVGGNGGYMAYSQDFISDSDTRSMQQQTLAPVANGNTHNFDVGSPAASNVNEITINDSTFDGATLAGLIDQYTLPAILAGSYSVSGVAVSARLARSFGGPTKLDLGVRSGGADWWGPDQTLNAAYSNGYETIWNTDPATGGPWAALPTNIGIKAVI
jgi:hypothetical protein